MMRHKAVPAKRYAWRYAAPRCLWHEIPTKSLSERGLIVIRPVPSTRSVDPPAPVSAVATLVLDYPVPYSQSHVRPPAPVCLWGAAGAGARGAPGCA
eukprot:3843642-Prymnesium_polylepis.1